MTRSAGAATGPGRCERRKAREVHIISKQELVCINSEVEPAETSPTSEGTESSEIQHVMSSQVNHSHGPEDPPKTGREWTYSLATLVTFHAQCDGYLVLTLAFFLHSANGISDATWQ